MRTSHGLAALFVLLGLPAAAVAGPVQVNVLLASQKVVPDPSPGSLMLPTDQPGNLLINPGGEVLLGTVHLGPNSGPGKNASYVADSPFSVFVKLTDSASGQTATLRVDGDGIDEWFREGGDGQWKNTFHGIRIGTDGTNTPFKTDVILGGNDYNLRVNLRGTGVDADFLLSVGPTSAAPEPATLLLAGLALLPVGLRAVRRRS
jgi:hypothetical protein